MKYIISLMLIFYSLPVYSQSTKTEEANPKESKQERKASNDIVTTLTYIFKGSYLQFTQPANLVYAGVAVPSLWYGFEHDKRISTNLAEKKLRKHTDIIGELGVAMGFPILPIGFYIYGRKNDNEKAMQFAMEYMATLYLVLLESAAISLIQIHDRPDTTRTSFWETAFRGDSSFPSGHVVPFAALTFKVFQFYGPYWAAPALVLTYFGSLQRVQDRKHFFTDVLGGFFLSAFASEGVRAAAGYENNHPIYKKLFEHDVRLGILRYRNAIGPRLTWSY